MAINCRAALFNSMSSSKRVKLEPAWPALAMTGPGGFDGEEKLKALCGD